MHKEIPILFSTDMVRAILAGRKTVTRRIVKAGFELKKAKFDCIQIHEQDKIGLQAYFSLPDTVLSGVFGTRCPYGQPGDILWVRETTYADYDTDDRVVLSKYADGVHVLYSGVSGDEEYGGSVMHWDYPRKSRPSIHMPKEAARIWLRVKDVRVERLQDITEQDAIAEGIEIAGKIESSTPKHLYKMYDGNSPTGWPYLSFKSLWEKINGQESWYSGPWVWVVSFEVLSTTGNPNC